MAITPEMRMKAAETNRRKAEERRAEKLMSTGVGESKIFAATPGTFPDPYEMIRNCHIEGKRIGDHYSDEQIAALRWEWTDEGFAARNEGKSERRVEFGADPLDKKIQQRKDDVIDRGMETWEAADPMKEAIERHKKETGEAGFRYRFLGDSTVKQKGSRGWEPVIKDGQPVTVGNLKLARMPEGKARQRTRHYQEQGNARLKAVTEKYVESGGKTAVADQ